MHHQGSLDGLCGIYAAINGISLMTKIDTAALFSYIIQHMRDRLSAVMLQGLRSPQMRVLVVDVCRRFCIAHNIPLNYRICYASSLDEYWQWLQNHVAEHGPGSVILGVDEHWTCIKRITTRTILLADSNNWFRLYRRHVSIGTDAQHQVFPKATFLLRIDYDREEEADEEAQLR